MSARLPVASRSQAQLCDDIERMYPEVAYLNDAEVVLAAKCGVSLAEVEAVLDLPEMAARLDAAEARAHADGLLVVPLARRVAVKLLQRIDAQADTVDAFEAAELMRPINRILENAERVRLAERTGDENLPVFNFIFGAAGSIHAELVSAPVEANASDVLDVKALPVVDADAEAPGEGEA
ncbi:hypothetical protein [Variovorax sp. GT1P44]|uniref:hypothetical protein n=1 Tax=Variovorax sp. GT1P44 TaxID=3443742 RepID=UPI003F485584